MKRFTSNVWRRFQDGSEFAFTMGMKYFVTLIVIAGVYTFLTRSRPITPDAPVARSVEQPRVDINPGQPPAAEPASNFLKRPIDRANAVVGLVRKDKAGESF